MKKLFVTALVLCWSASVHAGMPGELLFKSLIGSSEKSNQENFSGSTGQDNDGDNADGQGGSDSNTGSQESNDTAGSDQEGVSANDWNIAWGTKTPEMFLARLPAIPGNGCEDSGTIVKRFRTLFQPIAKELDKNIAERRRAMKKWNEKNSRTMMENAVDMPGFEGKNQAEMKKMSKAERKKMAEKMMQDKYGISMDDLKKQKKANANGKVIANVDFAKTIAGEQQANDLMKSKGQVEAGKRKVANAGKLAKEQAKLSEEALGVRARCLAKLAELERDKRGLELKKGYEREEKRLEEMQRDGMSCRDIEGQKQAVISQQEAYCSFMSARYLKILTDYKVAIQIALPVHNRLDQVANEMQKSQMGVGLSNASKGLNGLETVQDYARLLSESYKYNLRARDDGYAASSCE